MASYNKPRPPIGLHPRVLFYENRLVDVKRAIERYLEAGYPVHLDWIVEYNELVKEVG